MDRAYRRAYDIKVFGDDSRSGNSARCFLLPRQPEYSALEEISKYEKETTCFIWAGENCINVRCLKNGKPIRFCGHGLLAAAHLWKYVTATPSRAIPEVFIKNNDAEMISAVWKHNQLWLQVPRIHCQSRELPEDIADWFNPPPADAALAGDDEGYKIFIWPNGTDIATVSVDETKLCSDQRATILTETNLQSPWSFSLRYLAPQYGVKEDSATGSANVVLADYWLQTGLVPPFKAQQCSTQGGVIYSDVEGDSVLIGGNAAINAVGSQDMVGDRYANTVDIKSRRPRLINKHRGKI